MKISNITSDLLFGNRQLYLIRGKETSSKISAALCTGALMTVSDCTRMEYTAAAFQQKSKAKEKTRKESNQCRRAWKRRGRPVPENSHSWWSRLPCPVLHRRHRIALSSSPPHPSPPEQEKTPLSGAKNSRLLLLIKQFFTKKAKSFPERKKNDKIRRNCIFR